MRENRHLVPRLHKCVVGEVELRRNPAAPFKWDVRIRKGSRPSGWVTGFNRVFDALRHFAAEHNMSMNDFYTD